MLARTGSTAGKAEMLTAVVVFVVGLHLFKTNKNGEGLGAFLTALWLSVAPSTSEERPLGEEEEEGGVKYSSRPGVVTFFRE